jgi:hypothetical protein
MGSSGRELSETSGAVADLLFDFSSSPLDPGIQDGTSLHAMRIWQATKSFTNFIKNP